MRILTSLNSLVQIIPSTGRQTFEAILEAIRSLFGGDVETRRSVAFGVAVIALSAKMARADGIVSQQEVAAFQQILEIPPDEMRNVFRLYDIAKQDISGYEYYATRLKGLCRDEDGDCRMLGDVLDGLFHIAKADGLIHERELAFLRHIGRIFGLDPRDFERIEGRHVAGPDNPYAVLGLDPDAAPSETRARYLTLVRENHPDRLAARGVPGRIHVHRHRAYEGDQYGLWPDLGKERRLKPDATCVAECIASPNHNERRIDEPPDMLILHYTGMGGGGAAVRWLCDPVSEVSSHYLVHEDGRVFQMVPEERRAWHAGIADWRGRADVNSRSIGIEIVNPGHEHGYPDFPDVQIEAVIKLCGDCSGRWPIQPEFVLAHSDVAPARKADPGEKFPWMRLHERGIGHYVRPSPLGGGRFIGLGDEGEPVAAFQALLAAYGYGVEASGRFDEATRLATVAFQRHFRPSRVDGVADHSTVDTLHRLLTALPRSPFERTGSSRRAAV